MTRKTQLDKAWRLGPPHGEKSRVFIVGFSSFNLPLELPGPPQDGGSGILSSHVAGWFRSPRHDVGAHLERHPVGQPIPRGPRLSGSVADVPGHNHISKSMHALMGPLGIGFSGFLTSLRGEGSFGAIPGQARSCSEQEAAGDPRSRPCQGMSGPTNSAPEGEEKGFLQSPRGISNGAGARHLAGPRRPRDLGL